MHKYLFPILLLFCSSLRGNGQPEPIQPLSVAIYNLSYYQQQLLLWEQELVSSDDLQGAYFNYYLAAKNANTLGQYPMVDLQSIVVDVQEQWPNSFLANYLTFLDSPLLDRDYGALESAYQMEPDNPLLWGDMLHYQELSGEKAAQVVLMKKVLGEGELPNGVLDWNYNALMSVERNGILLTQGDNDTYPAWLLQGHYQVRPDVRVLNMYQLLSHAEYRQRVLQELGAGPMDKLPGMATINTQLGVLIDHLISTTGRPVHLGIATPADLLQRWEDDLYLTGLVFRQSNRDINNLAMLRDNLEERFRLDQLRLPLNPPQESSIVAQMNMNYIPGLALLYDFYLELDQPQQAEDMKDLALQLARRAGQRERVGLLFGEFDHELTIDFRSRLDVRKLDKQLMSVGHDLYASEQEVSNGEYQAFLEDLLQAHAFDQLEACKILSTDWRSLLPPAYQELSDEILFYEGHPEITPRLPVTNISHEAANLYCQWLSKVYNQSDYRRKRFKRVRFRLPTEAEWIAAARGGVTYEAPYPWGGPNHYNAKGCYLSNFNPYVEAVDKNGELLIVAAEKEESPNEDGGYFMVVVNSYHPNNFGLYNMAGNVSEMVETTDFTLGGGWLDPTYYLQIGVRNPAIAPSPNVGFRIFMEVLEE